MDKPRLTWEMATGYDLFVSLDVLHDPARYGLRGSWAAGVRSRIPAEYREFLQTAMPQHLWAIPWLTTLPGAKDGASVLQHLAQIPASERLSELTSCHLTGESRAVLHGVKEKGGWNEQDQAQLSAAYQAEFRQEGQRKRITEEKLTRDLENWSRPERFGEQLLASLEAYYEVFFAEEETRILPALEQTSTLAQVLAQQLTLAELLEALSQGLRFDYIEELEGMKEVILVPSFWATPLVLLTQIADQKRWLFMFGGRPADISLVPGEAVPELLQQTLKALADPTRLRIMRYLSAEPSTPAELARRLRLRAPTVLHHLDTLRLARLVHVTLSFEGRRYEARREAVDTSYALLVDFLDG